MADQSALLAEANAWVEKLKRIKTEISVRREQLQAAYDELEDIIYQLESGEDTLDDGLEMVREGLQELSKII